MANKVLQSLIFVKRGRLFEGGANCSIFGLKVEAKEGEGWDFNLSIYSIIHSLHVPLEFIKTFVTFCRLQAFSKS